MDKEIYDESFTVSESRWGTWKSTTLEGRDVITAPTKESCVNVTRYHLKGEQEGWQKDSELV